jgi:hypothetical protein
MEAIDAHRIAETQRVGRVRSEKPGENGGLGGRKFPPIFKEGCCPSGGATLHID